MGVNMRKKMVLLSIIAVSILLTLTGCAPGDGTYTAIKPAGFFWGIWHGWISPISLVVGLFRKNIRIYEKRSL